MEITVPRNDRGKADVPPGTSYRVVSATADTLTIEIDGETPAQVQNRRTIEQRLTDDLAAMQAIIDTPNQSLDTAALRKAVKAQARAMRRLIRHALAAYDATD